jgi:hypothetical protein
MLSLQTNIMLEGLDKKSLYSITPKGRKLLKGWVAFLLAYS